MSPVALLLRFLGALVLVAATYNPEGRSYFHWVVPQLPEIDALKAFVGVVLLIGWTIYLRAATRSLGTIGFLLAAAFFGTLIWLGIDRGIIAADTPRAIAYLGMFALVSILAVGMSWSHLRRQMAGQVDVDDVDED